ncbi:PH domain-containing protein [Salinispora arenicola]|uniref:PH domain-containing protein n=1 Tax=Salinispora arenicola TaxID=168697 RepID=UPI0009B74A20|nr:PH domain-containing protein [Salinispora arenicola]
MKTAWRSWFWNISLIFVMTVAAAICTGVALSEVNSFAAVGFGVVSVIFWVGAIRAPMLGVVAKSHGVVVRELMRTTTVDWGKINRIEITYGGNAPILTVSNIPVILWQRPNGEEATLELNALGSYGILRRRNPLGQQAVDGLNVYLGKWRSAND